MQGKWLADLQYLIANADASLLNVIDESVVAQLLAIGGDVSDFNNATDSLEALADAISAVVTAAVVGALDAAAATGAVDDATTIMGYVKQVVTAIISGTYGLSALQTLIAAVQDDLDNGTDGLGALKALIDTAQSGITAIGNDLDNGTDGLGAIKTAVDAVPTTAMRGTDDAALASVLGALNDAAASGAVTDADTLMQYTKQVVTYTEDPSGSVANVPQFSGVIYYVDAAQPDDTGDGFSPSTAKKTIGAAISEASDGDAITIKAGTYTETGLDLNNNAVELWCEIGAVIDPATGTALTVSGNYCKIRGHLDIDVAAAQIGVLVSGDYCDISSVIVLNGGVGFHITGIDVILCDCIAELQTSIGFDIDGNRGRFISCSTVGNGSTTGFNIGNSADIGVLRNCTSANHQTSGFTIEAGSANWTLLGCSSGGGDGKWVDTDTANVWSDFHYDDMAEKTLTFDASGATSANLFRVYGTVLITELSGRVETVLSADIGTGMLDLYDGTNTVDVTDSPGPSFSSVPAESFIHKIDDAGTQIAIEDSSQVRLYEDATKFGEDPHFQVTAKDGAASYIRFTYGDTGTSGAIHWHCKWKPLTPDGFVEAV